ncbi:hypothetical protein SK128_019479 [Halocaridina rubra]|uniref:Ribosomal L1 domain-containing protein 1 n=1 Tax=Halocaridina rubra TaxID=373956 RepID=A0AAN8WRP1_HALRR
MKSNPKPKSHPKMLTKKQKVGTVKKIKQIDSKPGLLPKVKKNKITKRNIIEQSSKVVSQTAVKKKKEIAKRLSNITESKENQSSVDVSIDSSVISQAIEGVRILEQKLRGKRGKNLLDDDGKDGYVYLQVGMLKVADLLRVKHVVRPVKIKVHLPHSIVNNDTEVLLIARDEDNKKKRQLRQDFSEHLHKFQEMIRMCGASRHINEVMTLRQLKVEYKEYEGKRHLANRVDIVLVDDTIMRRIPMFLGKHFYKKRKFPVQVNLKAKNLLAEIEKALTQTVLWLPMTGNSALMTIGRLSQTNEMIEENIRAALNKFQEKFPGGWTNIQNLCLKSVRSKAVPFYASLNSANDIKPIDPKPLHARKAVVGEVNTYFGNPLRVYPDGSFKVITKDELRRQERYEKMMETKTDKTKSKKKKKSLKAEQKQGNATAKKKRASEQGHTMSKKLKTSEDSVKEGGEENEEMKTNSNYDSLDVKDLDKMEMEYLKRISLKEEREKNKSKSSGKIVPDEDSDDAWAEFSDDEILSDFYDEDL